MVEQQINYRDANAQDRERILQITEAVFGPSTFERNIEERFGVIDGRDWRWRKRRHVEADLDASESGCVVAEHRGRVIGYVTIRYDREAKIGSIPNLAVDAEYKSRGIGRQLIQEALREMAEVGMQVGRIETLQQNEVGQHLYPDVGFEEVARQVYFAIDLRSRDDYKHHANG